MGEVVNLLSIGILAILTNNWRSSDVKFDLSKCKFPLDEFGENVIRALYLWDPKGDPEVTKSYKKYQEKIREELMEKDLILAKVKAEESSDNETSGWDFSLE